mgnify:CR=1 FL=1
MLGSHQFNKLTKLEYFHSKNECLIEQILFPHIELYWLLVDIWDGTGPCYFKIFVLIFYIGSLQGNAYFLHYVFDVIKLIVLLVLIFDDALQVFVLFRMILLLLLRENFLRDEILNKWFGWLPISFFPLLKDWAKVVFQVISHWSEGGSSVTKIIVVVLVLLCWTLWKYSTIWMAFHKHIHFSTALRHIICCQICVKIGNLTAEVFKLRAIIWHIIVWCDARAGIIWYFFHLILLITFVFGNLLGRLAYFYKSIDKIESAGFILISNSTQGCQIWKLLDYVVSWTRLDNWWSWDWLFDHIEI